MPPGSALHPDYRTLGLEFYERIPDQRPEKGYFVLISGINGSTEFDFII